MAEAVYPAATRELTDKRSALAPETEKAFQTFSRQVFGDGALPSKTKQLIAVAVAHVTQCPCCIRGHTKAALRQGATRQEIMEAVWVAAEMRVAALTRILLSRSPQWARSRGLNSRKAQPGTR